MYVIQEGLSSKMMDNGVQTHTNTQISGFDDDGQNDLHPSTSVPYFDQNQCNNNNSMVQSQVFNKDSSNVGSSLIDMGHAESTK